MFFDVLKIKIINKVVAGQAFLYY